MYPFFCLAAIAVIAFFGCGCDGPADIPVKGTISGSVINSRSGDPIPDASIQTEPFTQAITSAQDGDFIISSVPIGDYTVTASRSGFVSRSATVTVGGGGNATTDFALVPTTASIQGIVADSKTGKALGGVSISTNPTMHTLVSDSLGRYELIEIKAQKYAILVEYEGYRTVEQSVSLGGGDNQTINFSLQPTYGGIQGKVVDIRTGEALKGVSISTTPPTISIKTDTSGCFVIAFIPQGTYVVKAGVDGYGTLEKSIEVTGGEQSSTELMLRPTHGSVSAIITDAKTDAAVTGASAVTNPKTESVMTGKEGRFSLASIPAGAYEITVTADGYSKRVFLVTVIGGDTAVVTGALTPTRGSIKGCVKEAVSAVPIKEAVISTDPVTQRVTSDSTGLFLLQGIDEGTYLLLVEKNGYIASRESLAVHGGTVTTASVELLSRNGNCRGIVTDAKTGKAVAGATVSTDPATHAITADSTGGYQINSIAAAAYDVRVSAAGYVTATKKITITASATVLCNFVLVPSVGSISGQVTDDNTDLPVAQAVVSTVPVTVSISTDDLGRFAFTAVPTGTYTVTAQKLAFHPKSVSIVVESGAEAKASLSLIHIPDSLGNVQGRITDAVTGYPLGDVTITSDPATQAVKSDAQGEYLLTNVPAGSYSFSFTKVDYTTAVKILEVSGGKTAAADIVLTPVNGTVAGIITDDVTGSVLSGVSITTQPATQSGVSDAVGAFSLTKVPAGKYTITVEKSDYVSANKIIEVTGGAQMTADMSLIPSHGSITGKITDARTLLSLSGVTITTSPATGSVTTDANGSFLISRVASGTYSVYAAMADYSNRSMQVLVAGGRIATADMALIPSKGSISGTITDTKTGNPLAGASVVTAPVTSTVTADATGVYLIADIGLRDYNVSVTIDGYSTVSKAVTVKGGEIAGLDFSLTPNRGTIAGTVTDSRTGTALANATITTTPSTLSVTTNAQGQFTLGPISTGTYTVAAALSGFTTVTRQIVVAPGETATSGFVLTSQNGSITGKVTDRSGTNSLAGVVLTTTPATVSVTTDANGDFVFERLAPRAYTVKAARQGYYDATANVNVTAAQTSSANIQMDEILPVLSASPMTLNFSTQQTALQLSIMNSAGQGVLTYTIQKPATATWLTLSRTDGAIVDEPDAVICTVERSGLPPANYLADLVITSNGGSTTVQAVMVVPNPGAPQLTVNKSILDFGTSSTELQFVVSNTGTGTLNFSISDDMEWLATVPSTGSLNADPAVITVSVNRTTLTQIKTYTGRITLSSNGGSTGIDVALQTASVPLDPVTLSFTNLTSSGCRLNWTQVSTTSNFSAYEVYESSFENFSLSQATKLATISAYTTLYYLISAAEQTTKYYRVYAVNSTGAATPSNEIGVTFPAKLRTWSRVLNTASYEYELTDICSLDDNTAWACGYKNAYGLVLTWDNPAKKWNETALPSNIEKVYRMHALSADLVYATASGMVSGQRRILVLKNDHGAWSILLTGPVVNNTSCGNAIHVFNENLMLISCLTGSYGSFEIYRVIDGTWTKEGVDATDLLFMDENNGYASGSADFINKFNGYGWSQLPYTDAGTFGRLTMGSDNSLITHKKGKVYVYSNDLLVHTLDPAIDGYTSVIQTTFALDSTWIWVGGPVAYNSSDRLLHYNGTRFEKITIADNPGFYRFWFHSKQGGWALADNGIFMYR